MENKWQKIYPTDYNFLPVQDLQQAHYQMLLIIFLKELIELNINMDMILKDVELSELHLKIVSDFLNTQILKII